MSSLQGQLNTFGPGGAQWWLVWHGMSVCVLGKPSAVTLGHDQPMLPWEMASLPLTPAHPPCFKVVLVYLFKLRVNPWKHIGNRPQHVFSSQASCYGVVFLSAKTDSRMCDTQHLYLVSGALGKIIWSEIKNNGVGQEGTLKSTGNARTASIFPKWGEWIIA